MHPALIILSVVFTVHLVNLIGRPRIEAAILPLYIRLLYGKQVAEQRRLKQSLFETRQKLNLTSSQDEFAKWAKLRRSVDKTVSELEAVNGQLAGASSSLSLLVRAVLFLTTTLFPFLLTFYFGKTPMFFLPPSGSTATSEFAARGLPVRKAPGGFELPHNARHAWGMVNETYLGPLGWLLSMTAAPRGSVSAGMWSTICTRVALLFTKQIQDTFVAVSAKRKPSKPPANPSSSSPLKEKGADDMNNANEQVHSSSVQSSAARKRKPVTLEKKGEL